MSPNPLSSIEHPRHVTRRTVLVEAYDSCLRQVYTDHNPLELRDEVEYLHRLLSDFFHQPALTIVNQTRQVDQDRAPLL